METRRLYIVLTRSNTILSNLIHRITGDEYTHAALSLDESLEYMFSFGRRRANNPFIGCFRRESLNEGLYAKHRKLPGLVMELSVTSEEYNRAVEMVGNFLSNSHSYGYNYTGLMRGLFGVKSRASNRFLCSEFVYYVLYGCGICDFKLPRSLVRPQDLLRIGGKILYKGDLKRYGQGAALPQYPLRLRSLMRAG